MNVMRTTVATVVAATLSMSAFSVFAAASLTGAGATFPAPVYAKWADTYNKETGNKVNYQGIGSSGGVKQITANTVDFGASDAPLADDKLAQEGLFQFPTVIGGVVLAINLPGVKSGELVLDGKTLGDIYLGKIKKWDDAAIAKLNPGMKLPSQNIAVVRRADGSGTSFVFTSYLSKVNEEWKSKIGAGSTVNWPTGLGGKGIRDFLPHLGTVSGLNGGDLDGHVLSGSSGRCNGRRSCAGSGRAGRTAAGGQTQCSGTHASRFQKIATRNAFHSVSSIIKFRSKHSRGKQASSERAVVFSGSNIEFFTVCSKVFVASFFRNIAFWKFLSAKALKLVGLFWNISPSATNLTHFCMLSKAKVLILSKNQGLHFFFIASIMRKNVRSTASFLGSYF